MMSELDAMLIGRRCMFGGGAQYLVRCLTADSESVTVNGSRSEGRPKVCDDWEVTEALGYGGCARG